MSAVTAKIEGLGLSLPGVVPPAGAYIPALQQGDLVYTAGQLPMVEGQLPVTGRLGAEIDTETGYGLARTAALNGLAAIASVIGDLDRIVRVVKVTGFVASTPEFYQHPAVINGASDFLGEVFGDAGRHVRSAVGVAVLPLNSPVEVELIVEVREP